MTKIETKELPLVIYETHYDDGEYPTQLDYECQDDTGRGCCVSIKMYAFTDEQFNSLIRLAVILAYEGQKDSEDWSPKYSLDEILAEIKKELGI